MRTRRWHTHLLILAAYTLFALVLTWPVVARFGTHVPGNGVDDPPLTWNLWWVQHALLDLNVNPFECNYLFYPLGINLTFYTLTALNGLLSIPLQAIMGLIPASNLLLLSSFVLSGYGAFLLTCYLLPKSPTLDRQSLGSKLWSLLPSFTAGLLYAFASSKLAYAALGQWNIASSQWIPFYVLALFKMGDHPRQWRYPLLAALLLLLQAYAELTYASFLVLFTFLWAVWQALARRRRAEILYLVRNLAVLGCVFVAGLTPILRAMIPDLIVEGDIWVEGGGFADVFSADLLGFLVPTMYHPIFGSLVEHFLFDYSVGQHLYLGYSVLVLVLLGSFYGWRRSHAPVSLARAEGGQEITPDVNRSNRFARFWLVSAVIFWLLTLGPTLRINGHDTGLPLPFALIAQLPFFKGNRYPSRYGVLLFLSLAVIAAFGAQWLLDRGLGARKQRGKRKGVATFCFFLLVSVMLFEHLSIPLPLSDMQVPRIYRTLAEEIPAESTLLDLPVAWRNGFRVTGTMDPIIMFEQYYQSVHGRRVLAGNTSRNPALKFQYFTEAPVINTLIALETGHQVDTEVVERDRAVAGDVLRFFNIETIVVHPAQAGTDIISYLETTAPLERVYTDEEIVAYRVSLPPWAATWTITPESAIGRLSFAEGWGVPAGGVAWAQRKATRLLVPLNGESQRMTFRAFAPEEDQRLRLEVNGQIVTEINLAPGWMEYELTLPVTAVHPGLNEIWLRFERLVPADTVRLSPRAVGMTAAESPVSLVVQSAGEEVGDFGHIYVNGKDVSPNGRGYNVAVLHPQTGQVERVASFDTHLDERASAALAAFLAEVPPGRLVAVAAADEASQLLGQEAVDALRGIGATGDLRAKFRWAHAILGIQGALPGSALEAMDWMRPVTVSVGEGATETELAVAFSALSFQATAAP
jgi:hypothetical protein